MEEPVPGLTASREMIPQPALAMSLDEALKVLKINMSSPWDTVELTRRQTVDRAWPDRLKGLNDDKRRALQEESSASECGLPCGPPSSTA